MAGIRGGLKIASIPLTQGVQTFSPVPPPPPPPSRPRPPIFLLPIIGILVPIIAAPVLVAPPSPQPQPVVAVPTPAPTPGTPAAVLPPPAVPAVRPTPIILPALPRPTAPPAPAVLAQGVQPAAQVPPLAQVLPYGGANLWIPVVGGVGLIGLGLLFRVLAGPP